MRARPTFALMARVAVLQSFEYSTEVFTVDTCRSLQHTHRFFFPAVSHQPP